MMPVGFAQGLFTYAEEASGLPQWCARLHQPRGCGVSQGMQRDVIQGQVKPSNLHRRTEAGFDRSYRLAVPFYEVVSQARDGMAADSE
jgi:hypothetical protein